MLSSALGQTTRAYDYILRFLVPQSLRAKAWHLPDWTREIE